MSVVEPLVQSQEALQTDTVVNDFSITVGTKNGSGSQTSNLTIIRTLFRMGIPVSGKNLFPSNIQGLPTWYTIRVSKHGYLARRASQEIVIAMNPDSFAKDLASVAPGGLFLYADNLRYEINRTDITAYAFPANKLVKEAEAPPSLRDYVANMAYVGVLAYLINLDMGAIKESLNYHFDNKARAVDLNYKVISLAYEWARQTIGAPSRFQVEPLNLTKGHMLIDGNAAGALGAVYGGVQLVTWYPITPASSMGEELNHYLPELRKDPETGKNTFAVVQSEDELAAIGMAVGGGWAGLRTMTSTSGPGISLMTEFSGLAYYSETPVVIWDVQRMGPSTGLPTRTSQGDLTQIYFLGHGDTHNLILIPGDANECFDFGWQAFDYAERFQTPVFVLSDLDLGMNTWMTRPFDYPDRPMDRGKLLWEDGLAKLTERYGRYLDVDGDGIPYRTAPGNRHPASAWFARGTGHDEYARYTEDAEIWDRTQKRLHQKFDNARAFLPKPDVKTMPGARVALVAYGTTDQAITEARDFLAEKGVATDYLRIRALPFQKEVGEFLAQYEQVFVVEMNHTGQMWQLLKMEYPEYGAKMVSLPHNTGLPITAKWIVEQVIENGSLTQEAK